MKRLTDAPPELLAERIRLDNAFRITISLCVVILTALLRTFGVISSLHPMLILALAYNTPVLLVEWQLPRFRSLKALSYALGTIDILTITQAIVITGGTESPFFYLYSIPFLIHAFHLDAGIIIWEGIMSAGCYAGLILLSKHPFSPHLMGIYGAQFGFLAMILFSTLVMVRWLSRKERALEKSVQALRMTVAFLEEANAVSLDQPLDKLKDDLADRVNRVLEPFKTVARLWIYNPDWKTLEGVGAPPGLPAQSLRHLPGAACPAFSLRQPFSHTQGKTAPCPTEQFAYTSHLCLPIMHDGGVSGVLFLGTSEIEPWGQEAMHFFETLSHAVALTLQRKGLFERLGEKINELNCSFEVGVSSLASFVGSTQSLDETTIRILDGVLSILKVDRASLMLWSTQTERLHTQWARGGDFRVQSAMSLALGEGMAGWALKTGEPYWAEYAMGDPHYLSSAQTIKSLLCVPVFTMDRKPLGVINAVTLHKARVFTEREIRFLKTFGQQAGMAIENARLHNKNRANIAQLKEIGQMKSRFLSLVSHDLRGPLTGVRGFTEILKEKTLGPLNPAQEELLGQLERQVDLQERMVDDLLDLARMEKGQFSIHPVTTHLPAILEEEVEKSQATARERGVTLELMIENADWLHALVDPARIRQVVWNLIYNALKFTPEGGRVTVKAAADAQAIRIEVSDTGVGLAPDVQDRIFEKFFQVSPGGSKGAQGLGLGLAICKEIVTAHHGLIRATSPGVGRGTTMTLTLPTPAHIAPSNSSKPLAA